MLAPSPACSLNHNSAPGGIPYPDSIRLDTALVNYHWDLAERAVSQSLMTVKDQLGPSSTLSGRSKRIALTRHQHVLVSLPARVGAVRQGAEAKTVAAAHDGLLDMARAIRAAGQ